MTGGFNRKTSHVVSLTDGTVCVALIGEIDLPVIDDVGQWLIRAIKDHPRCDVMVDLGAVTYMDSTGIGALIRARNDALAAGVTFRIFAATGIVANILRATGVYGVLTGEEEA